MLITLIRHGKSSDMQDGRSQSPESTLSDNSVAVLTEMSKSFDSCKYDAIYTSTYKRAQQTAEILFGKEVVKVLDYVYESNMTPHLHGKQIAEVAAYWSSLDDTVKYSDDYRHTDGQVQGESFNEFVKRAEDFRDFLLSAHDDNEHIALVGHGLFFKVLFARLMQPELFNYRVYNQFLRYFEIENGAVMTLDLHRDGRKSVIREMHNWEIM